MLVLPSPEVVSKPQPPKPLSKSSLVSVSSLQNQVYFCGSHDFYLIYSLLEKSVICSQSSTCWTAHLFQQLQKQNVVWSTLRMRALRCPSLCYIKRCNLLFCSLYFANKLLNAIHMQSEVLLAWRLSKACSATLPSEMEGLLNAARLPVRMLLSYLSYASRTLPAQSWIHYTAISKGFNSPSVISIVLAAFQYYFHY